MSTPDPYRAYDAAYVLGALTPQDRADYEAHLAGCDRCAQAVRELAGLPGLLAQLPPGHPGAADAPPPAPGAPPAPSDGPSPSPAPPEPSPPPSPPATLLPALLGRVAAERRRRRRRTASAMAALALAAVLAVLALLVLPGDPDRPAAPAATPMTMTALVDYPVRATVSLRERDGLTEVGMDCRYGGSEPPGDGTGVTYVLVAVTREGDTEELASWLTVPDHEVSLSVTTPLRRADIDVLEIRTPQGYPVLRATLPG